MKLIIFVILSCFLLSSCKKEVLYSDLNRVEYHFYTKKSFAWTGLVYSITPCRYVSYDQKPLGQLVNTNSYDVTTYVKYDGEDWLRENIIYKMEDLNEDSIYMSATIYLSDDITMTDSFGIHRNKMFIQTWDVSPKGCSKKMRASFRLSDANLIH